MMRTISSGINMKKTLADIIGQQGAKKRLALFKATLKREGRLPNVGVWGRSGMGKTALIQAWADENGIEIIYTSGPSIDHLLSFRDFMNTARDNPLQYFLVFIDECHGLKKAVQTSMLCMLEKPHILSCTAPRDVGQVFTPEGITQFVQKGQILREVVPSNLAFAFASTNKERMVDPMLRRMRHIELDEYTNNELVDIAMLNVESGTPRQHMHELAQRSRSVGHLLEELLSTYKDLATLSSDGEVDIAELDDILDIDSDGATKKDLAYLRYINDHGTIGIANLANFLRKDPKEVTEKMEPFLLAKGWVRNTKRGRELTETGKRKLGALI